MTRNPGATKGEKSESPITLAEAKRAKKQTRRGQKGSGDDYGIPLGSAQTAELDTRSGPIQNAESSTTGPTTEPADPETVDHNVRRQARIAPSWVTVSNIPNPLLECGCGECPDGVDPLADDTEPWRDVLSVAENCDAPIPMTIERAATTTYAYETAAYHSDRTSRFERVRDTHGRYMDAERELLERWNGEVTTGLLSLRIRPVDEVPKGEVEEGGGANYGLTSVADAEDDSTESDGGETVRRWWPPVQIDNRLHDGWEYVRDRLRAHLESFEYGYCWVVGTTDSAATPHLHVLLWIRDPDEEITVEHLRPAVESFVRNTTGAYPDDHPVSPGESDAAVTRHDPPRCDGIDDDQLLHIYHERGDEGFPINTAGFNYVMNQRPEWCMREVVENDDVGRGAVDYVDLDGAAIAWASPNDWIGTGGAFNP